MNKDYRLIQVIESVDNKTGEEILIFELTPVKYNSSKTEFNFNPFPSEKNDFFIYLKDSKIENYYTSNPESIKTMNLSEFNKFLIKTPEGIRKSYFHNDLDKLRENSELWYSGAIAEINSGNQIAFTFSHIESTNFTYGPNYDEDRFDVIPSEYSDIELEEEENYIVIDKNSVVFCFKNINGIFTRIKGKVTNIEGDKFGRITKIDTLSNWALTDNVPISYEFNKPPINPLQKSDRNSIVTVFGNNSFGVSIRTQWSLLFGKYLGKVKFN
jgi:hypothetical protein